MVQQVERKINWVSQKLREREREKERFPPASSLFKCPWYARMEQAETSGKKIHLGLSPRWQELRYLRSYLMPPRCGSRKRDQHVLTGNVHIQGWFDSWSSSVYSSLNLLFLALTLSLSWEYLVYFKETFCVANTVWRKKKKIIYHRKQNSYI